MTTTRKHTAREYARIGLETGVSAASPHRMILLLHDGALRAVGDARRSLAAGQVAARGQAISRAIGIVEQGLAHSLDLRRGGALASQLHDLYDYINRRLLLANLNNDDAPLAEVADLLANLRGAWADIGQFAPTEISNFIPAAA